MEMLILSTFMAGVVGTGLGGFVGALFRHDSSRTVSLLLSLAAGMMLSMVCFDLIESTLATHVGLYTVLGGIVVGFGVVYALNEVIDRKTNAELAHMNEAHPKTHDDIDELVHADHLNNHRAQGDGNVKLFVAGIVMACAIALHNVPEGMSIGASYVNTGNKLTGTALVLSLLISFHNIPEGMAISVPLISGGMGRVKAVILTALSGAPTVIGAIAGYLLGDIGAMGLALSLSFASGTLLYVVFGEILPQAILMYRSKLPTFSVMVGMLLGMILIYG